MVFLSTDDADGELDDHDDVGHIHNQYEPNIQPGKGQRMIDADVAVVGVLRDIQL